MKMCKKCGVDKSLLEFAKHASTRDRLQTWCRSCRAEWLRDHRRSNPEKWIEYGSSYRERNREAIRERSRAQYQADPAAGARVQLVARVKRRFGLSIEEYDALVARPCAICGSTEGVVLDHCHESNVVRGPLCLLCNTGIGKFSDDPARLRAAADYLEIHKSPTEGATQ